MTSALVFTTTVVPAGPAAAIVLTDAQVDELSGGRRAPVVVTIAGQSERLRVARMGSENMIGLRKEVRASFGVDAGDVVEVTVTLDTAPREVEVPPALAAALAADGEAREVFEALAYTHRKEYAAWVGEAKREETRQRRTVHAIEMLRERRTLS